MSPIRRPFQAVDGITGHRRSHVHVSLRGRDGSVTGEHLDRPDRLAQHRQVRAEGVPEHVRSGQVEARLGLHLVEPVPDRGVRGLLPRRRPQHVRASEVQEGSKYLRSVLVQGAHVVASRSTSDELAPLRAVFERVRGTRGRRKIAIVALARHLLRIAYNVWRDGTVFDPKRVRLIAT